MSGTVELMEAAKSALVRGNAAEAARLLAEARAIEPLRSDVHLRLALAHSAAGELELAWESAKEAQRLDSSDPAVYRAMAMMVRMMGRPGLGIQQLRAIMATTPLLLSPVLHLALAELLATTGDHQGLAGSLEILEAHESTVSPGTAEGLRMQARLWRELGDAEGLERIAVRTADPAVRHLAIGMAAELRDGDPSEAYAAAADEDPSMWEALDGMARHCMWKGDMTGAEGWLERALLQAPRTAEVRLTQAELLAGSGGDPGSVLGGIASHPALFQGVRERARRIIAGH